jgi:hypothetical protein
VHYDVSPFPVSARELFAAFEANEVAANIRYKGQSLAVSGRASRIATDLLDMPYVDLDVGSPIFSVQAMFSRSDAATLAALRVGQQVIVVGRCDGKFGNVLLRDASLSQ